MSVIDTAAHNVVAYVSGKTKAFTGQRLATVSYKTIKDKDHPLCGVKRESKAVSLPVVSDESVIENLTLLLPHVKNVIYKAQDSIIREYLDTNPNASFITNESVSMVAVLDYLDNSNESGRLTKESVASWFDETIADTLMVTLADKMGVSETPTQEQSKQIEAIVAGFKDKVSSLAGGKTSYEPKLCESIKKCLALAPADDVLSARFTTRLNKMISDASVSVNLFDAL